MKWIGKHNIFDDLMIGGVLLTPPAPDYEYELTLPNDDGASGEVLSTDGSGVLSWVANSTAVPNALTVGDGLQLDSGTTWDGSVARTISVDLRANAGLQTTSGEIALDLSASSIAGTLAVGDGGTGASSFTDNAILTGNTTSAIQAEDVTISSGVIERSGDIEVAGTTVTLDSAGDVELEVGATSNYINTTGIYRGSNIGVISDTFIPILPIDFVVASSYRNYANMDVANNGKSISPSAAGVYYFCQKIIPNGYDATHVLVTGSDGGSTAAALEAYECNIDGSTPTACTISFALNVNQAVISGREINGDGEKFITIVFDPGDLTDLIFGGKIAITKR